MVGAFSFKETRHVLDERRLWVTPCVPDVDDKGYPSVVDDGLKNTSVGELRRRLSGGGERVPEPSRRP